MKKYKWLRIKTIDEEDNNKTKLRINDLFLEGGAVIAQLETKVIGDQITYYKIIKKGENSIEYTTIFDTLEED